MQGVAIVVFSDLVDSTALLARLGDDRMDAIVRAHQADVARAVEGSGGRVIKTIGDGAMATFTSALGALQAAAAIQASVQRLDAAEGAVGLAARVGISAGEPIANDGDLNGMSVVIAARLCAAAASGDVLVQDIVQSLVASRDGATFGSASALELKGIPGTVRAGPLIWQQQSLPGPAAPDTVESAVPGRPPLPRLLTSFNAEPLVGRDGQLAALREVAAFTDPRRAVLLLGEPGIGKTRLAAAAAEMAHGGGAFVVLARCPPEPTVAFEPWVRALGEVAISGDDSARQRLAAAAGSELAALVPELCDHAPARVAGSSTDNLAAEGARYRLLRGVGAALAHAAEARPVCIVLDDAHWCDAASTQVLAELLERGPFSRLALIVTARDRDLGRAHPVSRTLTELRRTRGLREIKLDGLDAGGLAALVSARVGRAITPRLATRLLARTKGNPFFAGELARDLDDRDALREDALHAAPVPDAVAGLVQERLARLDPATEQLLVAAAAIGPTAPVALAAAAAGLHAAAARVAVAQAVDERLVDEAATVEPAVTFPHALVREAFAAMPAPVAAARLHLLIAEALAAGPSPEPAEVARHRALAAPITGPEPAIAAHREAGTVAASAHDHEAASFHLDQALALMGQGDPDRGRLCLALGDQRVLALDLRRARDAYAAAAHTARATGDAKLLGRAALGFAGGEVGFNWEVAGDDPQVPAFLREALTVLDGEEPDLELGLIFRLLVMIVYERGDAGRAALVARAERLAEHRDDTHSQLMVLAIRFAARFGHSPDPFESLDGAPGWYEILELAERGDRDDWLLRSLTWAAYAASVTGEMERCDDLIERAGVVAERLGTPRFTWEVDELRAERLIARGDTEAGLALNERAAATVGRLRPDIQVAVMLLARLTALSVYDNDPGAAGSRLMRSMAAATDWGSPNAYTAFYEALSGDREAAWSNLDRIIDSELDLLRGCDGHIPHALLCAASAASMIGHHRVGERIRPLLDRCRGRVVSAGPSVYFAFLPEFVIGQLELLAGRHGSAVEELHAAIGQADQLEIHHIAPWARVELARALFRGGEPSDLGAAQNALAEAVTLAEDGGLKFVLAEAAKLQAEMDGRPLATVVPLSIRARPVRALAARSGRRALATLVRGLDDRELEERFLSPRRQRALVRAMARGFQPGETYGFKGVIAYELEPFTVEMPPDAPWRWAISVGEGAARLVEPAPLDAAVTIHFGLADWVRVLAGEQDPVTAMSAGRCRVEGDVFVASLLEPMFSAR